MLNIAIYWTYISAVNKSHEQNPKLCLWNAYILEGGADREQGIKYINNNFSDKYGKKSKAGWKDRKCSFTFSDAGGGIWAEVWIMGQSRYEETWEQKALRQKHSQVLALEEEGQCACGGEKANGEMRGSCRPPPEIRLLF